MRRRRLLASLCALGATAALGGCGGWYLRGTRENVLGDVKRVFIATPTTGVLYQYVATELSYIRVGIVGDRAQAQAIIEMAPERYERRVLSVDPDTGKVREVEVTLTTRIAVRAPDGSLISAPEDFRWTQDFVFDEASLLGTVEVEQNLRYEMAKVAARVLVLKLETVDFTRAGANAGKT
jgi:outer membrane lipopolysaccharide assembly protein LptE/RlpB